MTALAKVSLKVEIEDLTSETSSLETRFTHNITPEEVFYGYTVIGNTATNLDLGGIASTDLLGVLIIAKGTAGTDYVGILVNDDGTGTPLTTQGNITLGAGEATYLNFGGSSQGLGSGKYIRIKGSTSSTAIEYFCFGKH